MPDPQILADVLTRAVHRHRSGQLAEAIEGYRAVLAVSPGLAQVHNNLGVALRDLGQLEDSVLSYRRAIELQPDFSQVYSNLGTVLRDLGQLEASAASHRRSIELNPTFATAHNNLGNTLRELGLLDEAEASVRRALAIRRDYPHAYYNLGNILRELGRIDEAVSCLEQSVRSDTPDSEQPTFHKNLLMTLMYDPSLDETRLFDAHRRFAASLALPIPERTGFSGKSLDADRKLKIGYVSSDLRLHPVARNLLPVVRHHDRDKFELYFYADVVRPDAKTDAFRSLATEWRSIVGLSDRQVSELIRRDSIDILVCLAGRFDKNRPFVCAFRPAPIQIGYHDVATSGLPAMDYLLSDRVLTPRKTSERFTERVLCLPSFYVGEVPEELPPIEPREGPVVFGCLNAPAKINDTVLDLWAQILSRVPESHLILRYQKLYEIRALRARIYEAFGRRGVDPDRIVFPPSATSSLDHLMLYNEIDIALDPFPFSGSTTTFESLLMGVPVVTLAGRTMVSRWSAGILSSLGLDELIAMSAADYLTIAEDLVRNRDWRDQLRKTLRDRVMNSGLTDFDRKARQIERFYRAVWRRWCAAIK